MTTRFVIVGLCSAVLALGQAAAPPGTSASTPETPRDQARRLLQQGRTLEAEQALAKLTASNPSDNEAWFLYGVLKYLTGYHDAAVQHFETSLALHARNYPARSMRAICLVQLGRLKAAETSIKELLITPEGAADLDLAIAHSQLLYENGSFQRAYDEAARATRLSLSNGMAHYWKARALWKLNRLQDAIPEAKAAAALTPQHSGSHSLLLTLYRAAGLAAEAQQEADWLRSFEERRAKGAGK
ncbi:MAG: tetratricopeptide repeat protein [Acidobacteria bacterium]|nr:tetratricopeptide repeat protein [Acidobacteriota bacterium]